MHPAISNFKEELMKSIKNSKANRVSSRVALALALILGGGGGRAY